MNNIYYVYQYLSPLTGDPFYIGMGHGNRKDYHLKEAEKYLANKLNKKSRNLLKINTIVKLLRANILPIITIIEEHLTKEEASCLEQTLIEHYGRIDLQTGVLTNMTPGGDGIQSWSPAQKRAISNLKKGKSIYYDKTLSKLRLVSKTEYLSNKDNFIARNTYLKTNTNINNNLTNYIQAKHILTGEIKRLKKDSVEWLSGEYEGVMKNFKHAPRTEEHKEKLRQANLNKTISENTKLKMASSKKGLNYFTNETLKTYTRAREDSLNVKGYIRKKPAAKELKNYTYVKIDSLTHGTL